MKYSIALRNLPFEPETRQVIYVENQYDERVNAIIKEKYDWLKWTFKRANLDFVYLPMFFNDEEIKEKVLYYAPYLTEEIMEKVELRSSHLLRYMSHLENQGKIMPSFLYAPKKDNEEWVFQGLTIDLDGGDNKITKWFENNVSEIEEELTPNVQFSLAPKDSGSTIRFHKVEEEAYTGMAGEPGPDEEPQVEYSQAPSFWKKLKRGGLKFGKSMLEEESDARTCRKQSLPSLDDIQKEDIRDSFEELEKIVKKLRLGGVQLSAIHEVIDKYETISPLLITDNLRLILPDYHKEIKLASQYKAVYLLFIYHPEGIVLKQLEDYHVDLVGFFKKTTGYNELPQEVIDYINNLETYGNNQINTILNRIKVAFEKCIDKHLAKHYLISGKAGGLYKISLSENLIRWEDDYE